MNRNIHTHNAKLDLIEKFLDYADCADASYVILHYVFENVDSIYWKNNDE